MNLTERMKKEPIPQLILRLSAPAILSLLLNALNTAIDGMFVGQGVGIAALSAVTVSLGVVLIIQGFSLLVAAGTSSGLALWLGRENYEEAKGLIGNAFILGMVLSLIMMTFGLGILKPLLLLFGANEENIGFAMEYARVIVFGVPFLVMAQVMNNALKGMGYAGRAFINFTASVLVNTILDYIFIFIFHWGVFGAALSTVIGNGVCCLMAFQFICSEKCMAPLHFSNLRFARAHQKKILSLGLPACIMQLALSLVSLTFNRLSFIWGGTAGVAAYGMMYNVMMIIYMPIMGLGQGIQPIIGFNYSSGVYQRVRATIRYAILYATIFASVMFLLIELLSNYIVAAFGGNHDELLTNLAGPGLRLFCLMIPAVGFQMLGANYFQYIGKFKQSIILSALRQLVFLIPLAFLLPRWLGLTGLWLATPLADLLAFIVTIAFIRTEFRTIYKAPTMA